MNKKNYLIIGITIFAFVIAIGAILLNQKNSDWTTDIKKSEYYHMVMTDCEGREKTIDNSILNELSNKWKQLSNNGPWTGNSSSCYKTLTINYENKGIVKQKQIIMIDSETLVLDLKTNTIYYTNASEVINYLNSLF